LDDIEARIRRAYKESSNTMGWRFLSSPVQTLQGARVAFIGQNPGGSSEDDNHAEFSMKAGNLIPFRSPDWKNLKEPQSAIKFGEELWSTVLRTAQPDVPLVL